MSSHNENTYSKRPCFPPQNLTRPNNVIPNAVRDLPICIAKNDINVYKGWLKVKGKGAVLIIIVNLILLIGH
jgi:hypothetical protein